MKYNGLTNKGKQYLAKVQATDKPVSFSFIKFGDGQLSNTENPADLTDIKQLKVSKGILDKSQNNDAVVLKTTIDNIGLAIGYYPRETGIYVNDNGVEILYWYINDGDEVSWLPPEAYGPSKIDITINLIASNMESIVVNNTGEDLYASKEYVDEKITTVNKNAESLELDLKNNTGAEIAGSIQDPGAKVVGKLYSDNAKPGLFKCIKATSSTTNTTEFFEDISNLANASKLENKLDKTGGSIEGDLKVDNNLKIKNTLELYAPEGQGDTSKYIRTWYNQSDKSLQIDNLDGGGLENIYLNDRKLLFADELPDIKSGQTTATDQNSTMVSPILEFSKPIKSVVATHLGGDVNVNVIIDFFRSDLAAGKVAFKSNYNGTLDVNVFYIVTF